jgi:hypothetical protein
MVIRQVFRRFCLFSMGLDRPVAEARTYLRTHLVHEQLVSGAPNAVVMASP